MSDQAEEAVNNDDIFANMDSDEQPIKGEENQNEELEAEQDQLDEEPEEEETEEEEPEADEEEAEEEPEDELFKVTIKDANGNDEEVDLSLEELAAGYMRNADYTRKRGDDSAKVRNLESEYADSLLKERTQTAQQIEQLKAFVIQSATPELSQLTPELAQQDPSKYVELQAKHQHVSQLMAQLDQQKQAADRQTQEIEQHQHQEFLKGCHDFVSEHIPEFGNQEYQAQLYKFAEDNYQINQEELQWLGTAPQFKDGRFLDSGKMMKILGDAMSWHKLQNDKPMARKKVAKAAKRVKPRAPQPKSRHKEDMKRLKKGDMNAADRMFANL